MSDQLRTRRNTRPLGVVVLVVSVLAAGTLWFVAGSRRDAAIENLARAPIGCDTTLDFAQPGEYLIFVETIGRLDDVRGDCDAAGDFLLSTERPPVEITLIDPDGEPLEFESRRDDVTYSSAGFSGRSILSVEVTEAADHVMRAESSESATFAVSVGRDPNSGVGLLRILSLVTALVGLAVGLVLIIRGGRREPVAVGPWTAAQPTAPTWVQHPGQPPYRAPTQPPYVQPGAAAPYAQQGPYPQPQQVPQGPSGQPGASPTPGVGAPPSTPTPPPPDASGVAAPWYGPGAGSGGWGSGAAEGRASAPPPGGPWGQQAPPPGSPFAPPQARPRGAPDDADDIASSGRPSSPERAIDDASVAPSTVEVVDTGGSSWAPQSQEPRRSPPPPTPTERRRDTSSDE